MRLNKSGWKTIALENCFANHLVHKPNFKKNKYSKSVLRDISNFNNLYEDKNTYSDLVIYKEVIFNEVIPFWKYGFVNCILGLFLKFYDKNKNGKNK
jgi:hypothetical protein